MGLELMEGMEAVEGGLAGMGALHRGGEEVGGGREGREGGIEGKKVWVL